MAVHGALWLAKRYPSTLISVFLTGFRYFSYQAATQLSSRGWVDPVPDPIRLEIFLGYSRESNPEPLGWQSDVLTTIPNRWSYIYNFGPFNRPRRLLKGWYLFPLHSVFPKFLINRITGLEIVRGDQ